MTIFGETVQIYTTAKCDVGCPHCSSKNEQYPDMTLETFKVVVDKLKENGVKRVELFANNPPLHPDFDQQIQLLNESGLEYAILCVGNTNTEAFKASVMMMNDKGGLVFSVDYTEETSKLIELYPKTFFTNYSYMLKALTFWRLVPFLKEHHFKVRVNIVITIINIKEVPKIIQRVIDEGFAVSFCYVQYTNSKFKKAINDGIWTDDLVTITDAIRNSDVLNETEDIRRIISQISEYYYGDDDNYSNKRHYEGFFNKFRGSDAEEANIDTYTLSELKSRLHDLKFKYPRLVLPDNPFIEQLGGRPSGCSELLRQGLFPQLKIGTEGEILFCCDLHDSITKKYHITDFPEKNEEFLEEMRSNPHIWMCLIFNPCDFSVNYVRYTTVNNQPEPEKHVMGKAVKMVSLAPKYFEVKKRIKEILNKEDDYSANSDDRGAPN